MTGTELERTRGVTAVLGVVLLIAVTVVLSATVGWYFVSTSQEVEGGVQAGANVNVGDGTVSVSYIDAQSEGTHIEVTVTEVTDAADGSLAEQTETLTTVGKNTAWSTGDVSGLGDGDEVRVLVVAVNDDQQTVIADQTGTV